MSKISLRSQDFKISHRFQDLTEISQDLTWILQDLTQISKDITEIYNNFMETILHNFN